LRSVRGRHQGQHGGGGGRGIGLAQGMCEDPAITFSLAITSPAQNGSLGFAQEFILS